MNQIRTSQIIRTHRNLKGFRSCVNATGKSQHVIDYGRVRYEECRRLNRECCWFAELATSARAWGVR